MSYISNDSGNQNQVFYKPYCFLSHGGCCSLVKSFLLCLREDNKHESFFVVFFHLLLSQPAICQCQKLCKLSCNLHSKNNILFPILVSLHTIELQIQTDTRCKMQFRGQQMLLMFSLMVSLSYSTQYLEINVKVWFIIGKNSLPIKPFQFQGQLPVSALSIIPKQPGISPGPYYQNQFHKKTTISVSPIIAPF